jgi:hypothetical protein
MNNYEVSAIIGDEIPAIKDEITSKTIGNANAVMLILSRYTKKMINLHDLPAIVKCMNVVDKIYNKGNTIVKNAVENVFIYSFSSIRTCCNKAEWSLIQAKMPMTLYSIYVRQIYKSGI